MSHRSKIQKIQKILVLVFFFLVLGCHTHASEKNVLIQFYQEHISSIDGDRCGMHPSCSAYSATAFKKHGLVLGWIMTCDRLIRCGRDELTVSPQIWIENKKLTHDPVENNTWWFENKND